MTFRRASLILSMALVLAGPAYAIDVPPPPPATADTDGDGVIEALDRCPSSPARQRSVLDGCSIIDLAVDPRPVTDALRADLSKGAPTIGTLLRDVGRRPACSSLPTFAKLASRVPATRKTLVDRSRQRRPSAGLGLELLPTLSKATRVSTTLMRFCAGAVAVKLDPKQVTSIDATRTSVRLADGTRVLLGGTRTGVAVIPGAVVEVSGQKLPGAGIVIADSIRIADVADAPDPCRFKVGFVPIQQAGMGAPVVHDPLGYTNDPAAVNKVWLLEERMKIVAAPDTSCGAKYKSYALDVHVRDVVTKASRYLGTLTGRPGDAPVRLPGLDPVRFSNAYLDLAVVGLECAAGTTCRRARRLGQQGARLKLRPTGGYGTAQFARRVYSDAGEPGTRAVTGEHYGLRSTEAPDIPVFGSRVVGSGYRLGGFPTISLIDEYDTNKDNFQFDVYEDVPTVLAPTGLITAQILGTRHEAPFAYQAHLDEIVTDFIDFGCGKVGYVAPWPRNKTATVLNTDKTGTRLEVLLPEGIDILASRGGIVHATGTGQSGLPWVQIEHQDGSFAAYHGMVGLAVKVGEEVDRGTYLGRLPASADKTTARLVVVLTRAGHADWQIDSFGKSSTCGTPIEGATWGSLTEQAPDDNGNTNVPR